MLLNWSCQEAEEELEDTASNQDTACEACGGWQGHTTVVWGYRGGLICVCIYIEGAGIEGVGILFQQWRSKWKMAKDMEATIHGLGFGGG